MIEYKIVNTELERVMLGAVDGKLAFCHFVLPSFEAVLERVAADFPGERIVPFGEQNGTVVCPERVSHFLAREFSLKDLLCGRGSIFRWEDMYVAGTSLQVAVWREMYSLDWEELITYSQLAARCGYTKAVRAVASAVGKNPFSLVIPCHRVLRSEAFNADGGINANKLGNYYWGKELKLKILQKEGLI